MSLESKALHEFTSGMHNDYTKKAYMAHLRKYQLWSCKCEKKCSFVEDCNTKLSFDDMVNRDNDVIQEELERYQEFLQLPENELSKAYLKLGFASLTLFYGMNFKVLNKVRLRKKMDNKEEKRDLEAYTTEDIRKILDSIGVNKLKKHPKYELTRLRLKTMVLFLASSGVRVGVLHDVKIRDIGYNKETKQCLEKIDGCYSVKAYAKAREEYTTFLTPEASDVLDQWLQYLRTHFKLKEGVTFEDIHLFDLNYNGIMISLYRIVRKANLNYIKENKRYLKPVNHAHRYRFNSIAKSNKDVNPVLIERLLGHSTEIALDKHYLKVTTPQLFAEYKKLIKDLTIY